MKVSVELQKEVDELLASGKPPLSKWQAIAKLLPQHGLAWRATLEATAIVHDHNRGGMGVNGHTVHEKGHGLLKAGFDMSYLHNSVCCWAACYLLLHS